MWLPAAAIWLASQRRCGGGERYILLSCPGRSAASLRRCAAEPGPMSRCRSAISAFTRHRRAMRVAACP
ncbi:hypothetical protein C7U89_27500 [Bradyrhizobium sp. WBOS4]|nr:hypothetical protein [Bradyrhizobium sp. WBOS8]MDD1586651.1 hypothetical protein [Bradyrhizobium sp. WBOS4]UUO47493.1 hypothetical protein DCM78_11500 [Bradyrhizobium sp. WBOS04]UUO61110.1 hypothetical protein DCM80_19240 [Bradyrhizobium sp. WBOS08]